MTKATTWRDRALARASRYVAKPLMAAPLPWSLHRAAINAMTVLHRPPEGVTISAETLGPCRTRVATPDTVKAQMLWIHGGGFVVCSPESHAPMTDVLAAQGIKVWSPAYPLAPEHPFPAGYDACLAAARAMADIGPFALGGDSAGGGLAAAVLATLLSEGIRPTRVVLLSPATDFDVTRPVPPDADDMFLSPSVMHRISRDYAAGHDPTDPRLSPVHAQYPGCPAVLIHCCQGELLEGDTDALAARMRESGTEVTVTKGVGLPHVWHIGGDRVPAAKQSLTEIAAFMLAP